MKTKKALAVVLAVVMLVMPLAVSSFAATVNEIITNPVKTAYNDSEHFNPQGLSILVDNELIVYSPADAKFRFDPALNELLTVETTEIAVYYDNALVGTVPVTVEHILGELTAINHGHGNYCLGCGTLHNFKDHTVEEWIPNDDGGIFIQQTQTGFCTVCGAEVTENIPGTEKFYTVITGASPNGMTETEFMIVDYLNKILVTLIQMFVGIS